MRRRWIWGAALVAVLVAIAATVVGWPEKEPGGPGLAGQATVTASSTAPGSTARDVVTSGSAAAPGPGWRSNETSGAWVELAWPSAYTLRQIVLVRDPLARPGITGGFFSFGDGSHLQVSLSRTSRETLVPIGPRDVDRLRFTVTSTGPGSRGVALDEILVGTEPSQPDVVADDGPDGNAARAAEVSASGGSDPGRLRDGSATTTGTDWTTGRPDGAWVQLDWSSPRELTRVEIAGSPRSGATVAEATLTFGDGSTIPVGAVLANPGRPTVVSFMPRVTTSVRVTVDRVSGDSGLALGELRAFGRYAPPAGAGTGVEPPLVPTLRPVPVDGGCGDRPGPVKGVLLRCPRAGSVVDGTVPIQVSGASGYSTVTATVWPGEASAPAGRPTQAAPDPAGNATLTVDVGGLPPGPLTVQIQVSGEDGAGEAVYLQLYRRVTAPAGDLPSSPASAGRTLTYAEEFDRPLELSRDGAGADYTLAKPVHDGVQDFGDAIFADPARGTDTVRVVDNRYLRIGVEPTPPGYGDPQGWGRSHLGGLIASARPGGSGFSAQYGYFEARMLAPAAPGTWPAFWMLPSDNLVAPRSAVAEVDAVELYGHEATGACHSTHGYVDGRDEGKGACGQRFDSERDARSWHTYGVSVTPATVTFFIDGRVVASGPQVPGGDSPMFFLVDLALGGGWPVDLRAVGDRAVLYVDYVRVYV